MAHRRARSAGYLIIAGSVAEVAVMLIIGLLMHSVTNVGVDAVEPGPWAALFLLAPALAILIGKYMQTGSGGGERSCLLLSIAWLLLGTNLVVFFYYFWVIPVAVR